MNAQAAAMRLKMNDMSKVLATLSGQSSAHFLVTALSRSQAPQAVTRNCKLMLPAWFVQQHQDKLKLQDFVVLRSAISTVPCTVRLGATRTSARRSSKTFLGKGWKSFARNNELAIGDSLIFHLRGPSEFHVHIFRGTGAISSSHAPRKRSSDSELSRGNAEYDSSAGCSAHQQGSDGSQPGEDHLCEAVAKKRKAVGSEDAGAACTGTESPSLIKLRPSELENVQVSSPHAGHGQEPQRPKTSLCGAQNCRRSVHVKEEFQPPGESLPSFIQRLGKLNVQDTAGNTSGARLDIPFNFVKKHNVQLQSHVKLQGTREESPFRVVTCSYNMLQDSAAERSGRPPLSLGWGDFVRDNALREGQQLVFTLVSESAFVIKEVSEIVIYTK